MHYQVTCTIANEPDPLVVVADDFSSAGKVVDGFLNKGPAEFRPHPTIAGAVVAKFWHPSAIVRIDLTPLVT